MPMKSMFDQLKLAKLDGTYLKYMDKIAKSTLLIIDDFGVCNLDQNQALDLMEIIEDRHANKGTIIASQIPISAWYDIIPDSTIADAILDRIVHTAIRIDLKGDSLRKKTCNFVIPATSKSNSSKGVSFDRKRGQYHRNMKFINHLA